MQRKRNNLQLWDFEVQIYMNFVILQKGKETIFSIGIFFIHLSKITT